MKPCPVRLRQLLWVVPVVVVLVVGDLSMAGWATAAGPLPETARPDESNGPRGPGAPGLVDPPFDPGPPTPDGPAPDDPVVEPLPENGDVPPGEPQPETDGDSGEPGIADAVVPAGPSPVRGPEPPVGDADPPRSGGARTIRGLAYGPRDYQRLDLYLPAGAGPHGLIVFAHGGGWCCNSRADVPAVLLDLRTQGWAVASISYRLATATRASWPANLHDFKRATRWLRSEAENHDLDPDRVVAAGASSGGTLAALAATTATRTLEPNLPAGLASQRGDYQAVIGLAAPVNLDRFFRNHHQWGVLAGNMVGCQTRCSAAQLRPASPVTHLTAAAPPHYLAYGSHDPIVSVREAGDYLSHWARVVPGAARDRLWIEVANASHNLTTAQVNPRRLRQFLSAVATGVWPATANPLPRPQAPPFTDVPRGARYAPAVVWAATERIVSGVGGSRRFDPARPVTRAEFTAMLWRAVGRPPAQGRGGFVDVPAGRWFTAPASWAVATGVVNRATRFEPRRPITRAEAVAMVWRAVGSPPPRRAVSFTDVSRRSWAASPAAWAVGAGVVGSSSRFRPDRGVTRAGATAMVWRTYR